MTTLQESITKAQQCAEMLVTDIAQTQGAAIQSGDRVLEMVMRRLIDDARKIRQQLSDIGEFVK